ncbi:unnamed protein product [Orchesella dallaii]|uniref:carbonic anhydrase n=1 Tax=Orchesella dallaii TaxID=48710 RepID=A0ABP1PM42_9HEXA
MKKRMSSQNSQDTQSLSLIFILIVYHINLSSAQVQFCYSDAEGCGPETLAWGGTCHTGTHQSPIDLPFVPQYSPPIHLNLDNYKGSSFRIQNTGHTASIDFIGVGGPSTTPLPFPDPTTGQIRYYNFVSAHFHWGRTDQDGSEHCVQGNCAAMELHLVHVLSQYGNQADAVASGDPNGLSVLGVFIETSVGNNHFSTEDENVDALTPIVRHLKEIVVADNKTFIEIDEPLDFTPMVKHTALLKLPVDVFTYKGSLTSPQCNEQVNWYVMGSPALTSGSNVEAFRFTLTDARGKVIRENHRPRQALNGRQVKLQLNS